MPPASHSINQRPLNQPPFPLPARHSSIPFARDEKEKQKQFHRQQFDISEEQAMVRARSVLLSQQGLVEYIKENILPNLLFIRTQNGICGMGFFQHQGWVVSNAHVLPCLELLESASFHSRMKGEDEMIQGHVLRSFHRPAENSTAPDLVIIHFNTHCTNVRGLFTRFSDDEGTEIIYFYISCDQVSQKIKKLKIIRKISRQDSCPDIYECVDGSSPPLPGESGSPIFAARVLPGHTPIWQVCVVGVLYARCSPVWYNKNPSVCTVPVSQDKLLICAIPDSLDFEQIRLNILVPEDELGRAQISIGAARALRDPIQLKQHSHAARQAQRKMIDGIQEFEAGATPLNIALPDGLEKLWYKGIVKLENSLLIPKVFEREVFNSKEARRQINIPDVTFEELSKDYQDFIAAIHAQKIIVLKVEPNGFQNSPKELLRVDVIGGSQGGHWTVQLQDNTGKHKMKPKGKGNDTAQPLSSVFASIQLPSSILQIAGEQLAHLIEQSYDQSATVLEKNSAEYLQPLIAQRPRVTATQSSRRPASVSPVQIAETPQRVPGSRCGGCMKKIKFSPCKICKKPACETEKYCCGCNP